MRLEAKAWKKMKTILDKEMPVENNRKKSVLFYLIIGAVLVTAIFQFYLTRHQVKKSIHSSSEIIVANEGITKESVSSQTSPSVELNKNNLLNSSTSGSISEKSQPASNSPSKFFTSLPLKNETFNLNDEATNPSFNTEQPTKQESNLNSIIHSDYKLNQSTIISNNAEMVKNEADRHDYQFEISDEKIPSLFNHSIEYDNGLNKLDMPKFPIYSVEFPKQPIQNIQKPYFDLSAGLELVGSNFVKYQAGFNYNRQLINKLQLKSGLFAGYENANNLNTINLYSILDKNEGRNFIALSNNEYLAKEENNNGVVVNNTNYVLVSTSKLPLKLENKISLSLPILMKYSFSDKFSINSGIVCNYLVANNRQIDRESLKVLLDPGASSVVDFSSDSQPVEINRFTYRLTAGMEYQFLNRLSIGLNFFNYSISSYKFNMNLVPKSKFGILTTLNYRLGKN